MSFLYSRGERLVSRSEFLRVREGSLSVRASHFCLQVRQNDLKYSRIGIIASKRVGNAVKRNRAKRLIRELFRKYKSLIMIPSDLVVLTSSSITNASFSQLEQLFIQALRKVT